MFLSLIEKRRSTRKFLNQPVETEKIEVLIEATLRSPSSMGKNPWQFIVVTDTQQLDKIATVKKFGSVFVKNAPLAFVVCADEKTSDVWIEDASIAAIFLHLAAESMGLGSCWIQIRNRMHSDSRTSQDYLSDLLKIPENLKVLAMVAIGYPDEKKAPHAKAELQWDKVHLDTYGVPFKYSQ